MSEISSQSPDVEAPNYVGLASFRLALRQFIGFSQQAAKEAGLPPQQHQTILAIKGLAPEKGITIGELAAYMLLKHHTTVELVGRLVEAGLVLRSPDAGDKRIVRLTLTRKAEDILAPLTRRHMAELRRNAPHLIGILKQISQEAASVMNQE